MSDVLNLSNIMAKYIEHDRNRQARRKSYLNDLQDSQVETV
jgi:hypothetical protein